MSPLPPAKLRQHINTTRREVHAPVHLSEGLDGCKGKQGREGRKEGSRATVKNGFREKRRIEDGKLG